MNRRDRYRQRVAGQGGGSLTPLTRSYAWVRRKRQADTVSTACTNAVTHPAPPRRMPYAASSTAASLPPNACQTGRKMANTPCATCSPRQYSSRALKKHQRTMHHKAPDMRRLPNGQLVVVGTQYKRRTFAMIAVPPYQQVVPACIQLRANHRNGIKPARSGNVMSPLEMRTIGGPLPSTILFASKAIGMINTITNNSVITRTAREAAVNTDLFANVTMPSKVKTITTVPAHLKTENKEVEQSTDPPTIAKWLKTAPKAEFVRHPPRLTNVYHNYFSTFLCVKSSTRREHAKLTCIMMSNFSGF